MIQCPLEPLWPFPHAGHPSCIQFFLTVPRPKLPESFLKSLVECSSKSQVLQIVGQSHAFQTLLECSSKSQSLQTAGQSDPFQTLVEVRSKSQILQTGGQGHAFQTLVEFIAKGQILQTVRQGHAFQTLVEAKSKGQALQTVRQGHTFKTLEETKSKNQGLQTIRQGHAFQTLAECSSKSQILQTAGQSHPFQTLVECITKSQTDKASWQMDLPLPRQVLLQRFRTPSRRTMQPATGSAHKYSTRLLFQPLRSLVLAKFGATSISLFPPLAPKFGVSCDPKPTSHHFWLANCLKPSSALPSQVWRCPLLV